MDSFGSAVIIMGIMIAFVVWFLGKLSDPGEAPKPGPTRSKAEWLTMIEDRSKEREAHEQAQNLS